MACLECGAQSRIDRFIGYYAPYATSHQALDEDTGMQAETDNVARAVINGVAAIRDGRLHRPDEALEPPRAR